MSTTNGRYTAEQVGNFVNLRDEIYNAYQNLLRMDANAASRRTRVRNEASNVLEKITLYEEHVPQEIRQQITPHVVIWKETISSIYSQR